MSLLDWGNELVTVFGVTYQQDEDGDTIPVVDPEGTTVQARVQPIESTESQVRGFMTGQLYRLIIARHEPNQPDAFAEVEWRGERYEVVGEPEVYTGSPRTARKNWIIRRS